MNTQGRTITGAVTPEQIRELFATIGAHGRTADGGCHRPAFTPAERAARADLMERSRAAGYMVVRDEIGSVFVVRPGTEDTEAIYTGSHLDSVPYGGCFDGATGVLCGLAALELLDRESVHTKRPIVLVCWANEEGARFTPAMMGSGIFTRQLALDEVLTSRDRDGTTVAEELAREETGRSRAEGGPISRIPSPAAYIELHPEQGRVLENAGIRLGVVEGVQAQIAGDWRVTGRADHAGATPMNDRTDALVAAARIVADVPLIAHTEPPGVATVGSLAVHPGARNAVPGAAEGTIDIRHPDRAAVKRLYDAFLDRAQTVCTQSGCTFSRTERWTVDEVHFSETVATALENAARSRGVDSLRLSSGAGHDAMRLARVCDAGMLFLPSRGGISHSPDEYTSDEDLALGATILADAIVRIAT